MYDLALLNAARAFALVCFADGRLVPTESLRFHSTVASDPEFKSVPDGDIADAWAKAVKEVEKAQSFGGPLVAIRTDTKTEAQKAMIMRIAQAAVVADRELLAQENGAIFSLAEALGLDPAQYQGG
jgi:tellurite resistance protein